MDFECVVVVVDKVGCGGGLVNAELVFGHVLSGLLDELE